MNYTTVIPTDLITPLGAHVRLRAAGEAAFLLESVEHGRLGRYSVVGCGARTVGVEEAEHADAPVVGFLAYDHAAVLEPTVALPAAGPDLPESRFVLADTLVRFDHAAGLAQVLCGDPEELRERLEAVHAELPRGVGARGPTRRRPGRFAYERSVAAAKKHVRAGDAEKDCAEHVMLVHLGRNDLSLVCRAGTVRVERFMEAERFSHVTHLVSEVVGELQAGAGPFDLLRACFPAGTVSGGRRFARCS